MKKTFAEHVEKNPGLLQKMLEQAASSLVITDHTKKEEPIIYCNDAFTKLTGYSRSEVLGRNCRFLQGDYADKVMTKTLRKAINNGVNQRVVIKNYKKDGTFFWNELAISPIKNDNGVVTHFLGIQKDVTHEHEKHLQKQDFVSLVSHELRNPLLVVMMYTELLELLAEQQGVDDTFREYITKIGGAAERIERLLKDLRDVASVETSTLTLKKEKFNVANLIYSIAQEMCDVHDCKIDVELRAGEKKDYLVFADKIRVRQVVVNLVTNALKHSGKDKVTIYLDKQGDCVTCTVRDYGVGISKQDKQLIFEKFGRTKDAYKKNPDGLGLGLYIAQYLVSEHGGTFDVRSTRNRGASFIFTLPKKKK
jgi:PAS domain S-box-containing protein